MINAIMELQMSRDKRIETITRDIRHGLEDIITKLNEVPPDKLHDDITMIIQDCEILEQAVGNPNKTEAVMVTGNELNVQELLNKIAGVNGPDESVAKAIEVTPSFVFRDLNETVIRLNERLLIEYETLDSNTLSNSKIANIQTIRLYLDHLRAICDWFGSLDSDSYDALHEELGNIEDDKEDEDDE